MSNTIDVASEEIAPLISLKTDVTLDEDNAVEVSIPVGLTTDVSQEEDVTMADPPIPQLLSHPTEADLVKACKEKTFDTAVQVSIPQLNHNNKNI